MLPNSQFIHDLFVIKSYNYNLTRKPIDMHLIPKFVIGSILFSTFSSGEWLKKML